MTTFLLVHGAFRGGWSWGRVAARLAVAGHRVLAPDLPGAGRRWHEGHEPVGLEDVLDDLAALAEGQDLRDVVLVGHSQGGFVAEALTQRIADRLAHVLHLDAPVPHHGQCALDFGPPTPAPPPRDLWVPASPLDPGMLGVSSYLVGRWNQQLTPLSVAIALDPVVLDAPTALAVPRSFAFCAGTPDGFPVAVTRAARAAAGHDDPVLESPHDAPLARPDLVADWLQFAA